MEFIEKTGIKNKILSQEINYSAECRAGRIILSMLKIKTTISVYELAVFIMKDNRNRPFFR